MQTDLQNRRRFLVRSALGIGGVLFSSVLLESCFTDHVIPPDDRPPLFSFEPDYNDDAKIVITALLEKIPVAGEFLGPLLDIFWPKSKENVWDEIKDKVEALIDEKIAIDVYQDVTNTLGSLGNGSPSGLLALIVRYQNAIKQGTPSEKDQAWTTAVSFFEANMDSFKSSGKAGDFQVLLLPLFAQYANLYIGLLRDGVLFGQSWGRTDADHQQDLTDLKNRIAECTNYAKDTYWKGRNNLSISYDAQRCEPFRSLNNYDRAMYQSVLDYSEMWQYSDTTLYPNGAGWIVLPREIYSDPYGSTYTSGPINMPFPAAFAPTNITIWAWDRIDAAQLTYPPFDGPNELTQTPKMGDSGGASQPPQGGVFNLSLNNPITSVRISVANYLPHGILYGPLPNRLQFIFADGTYSSLMGGMNGVANGFSDLITLGYPNMALSSIFINGVDGKIGSADSIVLGFKEWYPSSTLSETFQDIYIKSPTEHTESTLTAGSKKGNMIGMTITEKLKAERKAHWEYMRSLVE